MATMNEFLERALNEEYSQRKLPKEAIKMGGNKDIQAYIVNKDGSISVWEKKKKKGWQEWWTLSKQDFAKEFGVKVK